MKVIESCKINKRQGIDSPYDIYFIRIEPEDLSLSISEVLEELADLSWLNKFDKSYVKDSFRSRAQKTCSYIKNKLLDNETNTQLIDKAGEYIVSCLAKKALVNSLQHTDIPTMELLGRKISNNPGFDFYTEKDSIITACESKYLKGINAYTSSLSQINRFIKDNKHIDDIALLYFFATDDGIENLNNGLFAVGAAFSVTEIDSQKLIAGITNNSDFQELAKSNSIFLLAVNIHE